MGTLSPICVLQANDVPVSPSVLEQGTSTTPQDCTGYSPVMVVKASPNVADAMGTDLTYLGVALYRPRGQPRTLHVTGETIPDQRIRV